MRGWILGMALLSGCALAPELQPGIEVWACEVVTTGPSGQHRVPGWGHDSGAAAANARRAARAGAAVEHALDVAASLAPDGDDAWNRRADAWLSYSVDDPLAVPGWTVSQPSCSGARFARRPAWVGGHMGTGPSRNTAPAAAEAGRAEDCWARWEAGRSQRGQAGAVDEMWSCLSAGVTFKKGNRTAPPASNRWTCVTHDGAGHAWSEDPELAAATARIDGIANRAEALAAQVLRREIQPEALLGRLFPSTNAQTCSTGYPEPLIWEPRDIDEARDCGIAPGSGVDRRELTGGKIEEGRDRLCRRTVWEFGDDANAAIESASPKRREDLRRSAWGAMHRCHSSCMTHLSVGPGPAYASTPLGWARIE